MTLQWRASGGAARRFVLPAERLRRFAAEVTDTALRNLKPKSKIYKAYDRDGMYVTVSPTGTVTFR